MRPSYLRQKKSAKGKNNLNASGDTSDDDDESAKSSNEGVCVCV